MLELGRCTSDRASGQKTSPHMLWLSKINDRVGVWKFYTVSFSLPARLITKPVPFELLLLTLGTLLPE